MTADKPEKRGHGHRPARGYSWPLGYEKRVRKRVWRGGIAL